MFNGLMTTRTFVYGLGALMISTITFVNADQYNNQNYYQNQRPVAYSENVDNSGNATLSDADLLKKVRDKISSGWFSKGYDQVTIEVKDGNVILQGNVKTWSDKEKIEKEIRNINGVKSLDSKLTVQEAESKTNMKRQFPQDTYITTADDQLNKKIRDNVSTGWLWTSYQDVTLNTTNGTVNLEGSVDSLSDQQKLMTEIQKIDGVKTVKSNLRIKNR